MSRNSGRKGAGTLLVLLLLACGAAEGQNTGIHISGNGRYFVDTAGQPFFWQGDTEWELFHAFSVADAKALLLERHNQGFNVIQVMVAGVYPEWAPPKE